MRPLTILHFLFRREKGSEKACGRTRFGQIPLIAHLGNGARDTRSVGVWWRVLCLVSCQRARLIHFPNGRGICLRFVWPPPCAARPFFSFGLQKQVRLCSFAVVWRRGNGATPHPLRGSSPLRRGAKAWRVAKLDFFKDCRPLRQERAVARAPGLLIPVAFTATITAYPGSGPAGPAREGGKGFQRTQGDRCGVPLALWP